MLARLEIGMFCCEVRECLLRPGKVRGFADRPVQEVIDDISPALIGDVCKLVIGRPVRYLLQKLIRGGGGGRGGQCRFQQDARPAALRIKCAVCR